MEFLSPVYVTKFGSNNMTVFYPFCYNKVCYKGTALYFQGNLYAFRKDKSFFDTILSMQYCTCMLN